MAHHAHTPAQIEAPDAWHTHTVEEHPMEAHAQNIDGLRVFVIGTIGYLLTVATIVVVAIYFFSYRDTAKIDLEEYPERLLGDAGAVQKPALDKRAAVLGGQFANSAPQWTDAEAGKVTISIEQATSKVIERYKSR